MLQKGIPVLISRFFVITLAAAAASTSAGTISGVVVDDSGNPISGASVVYRSVPPLTVSASGKLAHSGPVVSAYVSTSADGAFALENLPPGNYNLCAYGVTAADLGSCEWVQGTTHVSLASAQTVQVHFHVSQGVLITFQVADLRQ
jgi:Carboxypeptidase regulatory-like domain